MAGNPTGRAGRIKAIDCLTSRSLPRLGFQRSYGALRCYMGNRATKSSAACGPKLALGERQLISSREADALERTFKVLANGTRLRLLHALVLRPGISVTELARVIGMKPQAVSNQLQRLTDKAILASVREGTSVRYRVIDPCVVGLLDHGLCLTEDSWTRQKRLGRSPKAA